MRCSAQLRSAIRDQHYYQRQHHRRSERRRADRHRCCERQSLRWNLRQCVLPVGVNSSFREPLGSGRCRPEGASAILYDIPVVSSTFVGTTHSNTSVTVTSGTVTASDVGAPITGTGIPAGTYISAFTSPTVTLSAAATSSASGITFAVAGIGTPTSAVTTLSKPATTLLTRLHPRQPNSAIPAQARHAPSMSREPKPPRALTIFSSACIGALRVALTAIPMAAMSPTISPMVRCLHPLLAAPLTKRAKWLFRAAGLRLGSSSTTTCKQVPRLALPRCTSSISSTPQAGPLLAPTQVPYVPPEIQARSTVSRHRNLPHNGTPKAV